MNHVHVLLARSVSQGHLRENNFINVQMGKLRQLKDELFL